MRSILTDFGFRISFDGGDPWRWTKSSDRSMVDYMQTSTIILLVVAGVVGVVFLLSVISKLTLHFIKRPLEARIAAHYVADEILMKDLTANSFGQESLGVFQARGNGGLVLTADCLHFFMFLPKRDLRIPLDAITDISFTKTHLGKATIYDLLKVRFSANGASDSIAWYLTEPTEWKSKIEELKAGRAAV
jgi:hypothetical protein